MTRKQKKAIGRLIIAAALFLAAVLLPVKGVWRLLCFLVPYFFIGWDVLWSAVRDIGNGQIFGEKLLMAVATVGALALGEYPEAVFVMLFFQVGELFENIAVGKSRQSIAALMDIRPEHASVERDGELVRLDPEEVPVGETIVVKPGERIPLDGVVLEGSSSLDTAALTGESLPRDVGVGDGVISGCVNLSGLLRIETTKEYGQSTVSKILELVESSAASKSKSETFITRFARWYTPAVVLCAVLLAVIPPLFTGAWGEWIRRALIFLVISCPCALVISVPLTFFGGIGAASKRGVLIKGSNYLDALTRTELVVLDKTGTLTRGSFTVTRVCPASGVEAGALLELAALAEAWSDHPISVSLRQAGEEAPDKNRVTEAREEAGHGVIAKVDGREVLCGNEKLMRRYGVAFEEADEAGTVVHVAADGTYAGYIVISDTLKDGAAEAVKALGILGVRDVVMLTGDREQAARAIADELGIGEVHAELLPGDKVDRVVALMERRSPKGALVFVGDGINDAPVLSRADVGIAMGALGADAAIEAADVVLMDDKPEKIAAAISIARRTKRIANENISFALAVKFAVLILGAVGLASMWLASFADVGVCVIAVLNAMRALSPLKTH